LDDIIIHMAWYPHFDSISPGALLLSAQHRRDRQQQQQQQQFYNLNRYNNNMAPLSHGDSNDNPSQQYLTWNRINLPPGSIVPPRRSGAASVVVRGKLYMFGVSILLLLLLIFVVSLFCVDTHSHTHNLNNIQ
jgi:hypothetical protein